MKTKIKRIVSLLLASLMILGAFQVSAFAEDADAVPVEESRNAGQDNENGSEDAGKDFSSMRLIVGTGDETVILHPENVISSYEGIYLLQFESIEEAREAYEYYKTCADLVDVDTPVVIADDPEGEEASEPAVMTEEDNPITVLNEIIESDAVDVSSEKGVVIALIDTGVSSPDVCDAVSLIDDDPSDGNGHGTRMFETILAQNENAKVFSIKALGADGVGDVSAVYAAIKLAIEQKVSIINLSVSALRSADNSVIEEAINDAVNEGIIVEGAAGNNGNDSKFYVPGGVASAEVIGAADEKGARLAASNYGEYVDYYVSAESTSYAAATFTGFISKNGLVNVETDQERFITNISGAEKEESEEKPAEDQAEPGNEQQGSSQSEENPTGKEQSEDDPADGSEPETGNPEEGGEREASLDEDFPNVEQLQAAYDHYLEVKENSEGKFAVADRANFWKDTFGITRKNLVDYLNAHKDEFLGTPYEADDPAATPVPGVGMQCTGFVWYVFNAIATKNFEWIPCSAVRRVAPNYSPKWDETLQHFGMGTVWNGGDEALISTGQKYMFATDILSLLSIADPTQKAEAIRQTDAQLKQQMLQSGILEKGDIIWMVCFDEAGNQVDTHVGIFWGDTSSDDKFWHSFHNIYSGESANKITKFKGKAYNLALAVYKLDDEPSGSLKVKKVSNDAGITNDNSCYSLKGAVYKVYGSRQDALNGTNTVGTLTTTSTGESNTLEDLEPKTYYVKETKASKGYGLCADDPVNHIHEVTVKSDQLTTFTCKEPPLMDPVSILLKKESTKPAPDGSLKDAEFTIEYYPSVFTKKSQIPSSDPVKWWKYKTNAQGFISFRDTSLKIEGSDYWYDGSNPSIPAGTLVIKETKAPDKFKRNTDTFILTLTLDDNNKYVHTLYKNNEGTGEVVNVVSVGQKNATILEEPEPGVGHIVKKDSDLNENKTQGDASMKGIRYAVVNRSGGKVKINDTEYADGTIVGISTLNASGKADTVELDYGKYTIYELRKDADVSVGAVYNDCSLGESIYANSQGYKFKSQSKSVTINSPGQEEEAEFTDPVVRGGLHIYKADYDTGRQTAQGDATLSGIRFAVVNRSAKKVYVNSKWYEPGQVVKILTTDAEGQAKTKKTELVYGTYEMIELREDSTVAVGDVYDDVTDKYGTSKFANASGSPTAVDNNHSSMLFNSIRKTFSVRYQEEMVGEGTKLSDNGEITEHFEDDRLHVRNKVVRGSVSILKKDDALNENDTQGDAVFQGIKYALINKSDEAVFVDNELFEVGEVIKVLKLDATGAVSTEAKSLPYGTYRVVELRDDAAIYAHDLWFELPEEKFGESIYANKNGYLYKEQSHDFRLREDGQREELEFEDPVVRGGLHLYKGDYDLKRLHEPEYDSKAYVPQGDASLAWIRFAIVNRSVKKVLVNEKWYDPGQVVQIITTDEAGEALTKKTELVYGTYDVIELREDSTVAVGDVYDAVADKYGVSIYANKNGDPDANNSNFSSMLFDAMKERISIRYQEEMAGEGKRLSTNGKQTEEFTDHRLRFVNHVGRGGVHLYKADQETKNFTDTDGTVYTGYTAQGDASLTDIKFAIVNRSLESVVVNGVEYDPGKVVHIMNTDKKGEDKTTNETLPYGTYEIIELRADNTVALGDIFDELTEEKLGTSIYANKHGNLDYPQITGNLAAIIAAHTYVERSQQHGKDYRYMNNVGELCSEDEWAAKTDEEKKAILLTAPDLTEMETWYLIGVDYSTVKYYGSMLYKDNRETFEIRHHHEVAGEEESDAPDPNNGKERIHFDNRVVRGGFELYKLDKETRISYALGGATLEGIEFTLKNISIWNVFVKNAKYPEGHLYKPGEIIDNEAGEPVWTTDNYGRVFCNDQYLPYGTYLIWESDTNDTYMLSDPAPKVFQIHEEKVIVGQDEDRVIRNGGEADAAPLKVEDQVVRADFRFQKKDENGRNMANIPWVITNVITGEKHYILTDENGQYDSRTDDTAYADGVDTKLGHYEPHTLNTNAYDEVLAVYDEKDEQIPQSVIDGLVEKYQYRVGTWFGLSQDVLEADPAIVGTMAEPRDDLGAFPYGLYTFRELFCDANEHKALVDDEFMVYRMNFVVDFGTIDNEPIAIKTMATDTWSGSQTGTQTETAKISDRVEYHGVDTAKDYKLVAELRAVYGNGKDVSYTLSPNVLTDADGKVLKFEKALWEEDEVHTRDNSTVMNLEFNSMKLFDGEAEFEGGRSVICEYLYEIKTDGKEKLAAIHARPDAESQWIDWPHIGTTLTDKATEQHVALASEEMVLVDSIAYTNLKPNTTYTFTGTLYDKETGEPALDDNGEEITATGRKRITEANGIVEVTFKFSGLNLAGRSVVAFEECDGGGIYVVHADINDEDQTVDIPKIRTTLTDKNTDLHITEYGDTVILKDTVSYENLTAGETYTMKGQLFDKEGNALLDITAEKEFTAEAVNGTVELEFAIPDFESIKGKTLVAFENCWYGKYNIAKHENPDDQDQTVYVPDIGTTAVGESGIQNILAGKESVIVDTVAYKNLKPNTTYVLEGKVWIKEDQKMLEDADHNSVMGKARFTTSESEAPVVFGTAEVKLNIDASVLAGKQLVVFEYLYEAEITKDEAGNENENIEFIVSHADAEDASQTIYVPDGRTNAVDKNTEIQNTAAKDKATIMDIVTYKNLIPGKTYTVTGILMDKATKAALLVDEKEVTASKEFVPTKADGQVALEFTLDASALAGKTLVAFETVTHEGVEVFVHADLDDEDQTIYIPDGRTKALDKDTEIQNTAPKANAVIVDTVTYRNLIPGKTYTLSGTLMDKETGKAVVVNGSKVTAAKEFIPEKANGSVELEFVLDASALAGKAVVAFEMVTYQGKEVFTHADINDEDQTVYIPDGRTTAKDKKTGSKNALAEKEAVIVDTVVYRNLIPGKKYTVTGTLMDKETGKELLSDGKKVTAEKTFTAKTADGEVVLEFRFDASAFAGKTVVAFEKMTHNGKEVFVHADLNDEDQSVHFPKIGTEASVAGAKEVEADAKVTITDVVRYENLIPGEKYSLSGILMDKKTGKKLKIDGKTVSTTVDFTAKAASGQVKAEFSFEAKSLGGHSVVVFEKLYLGERKVAVHEDINDKGQTVKFKTPPTPTPAPTPTPTPTHTPTPTPPTTTPPSTTPPTTTKNPPKTGDSNTTLPFAIAIATSAAGIIGVVLYRRKRKLM